MAHPKWTEVAMSSFATTVRSALRSFARLRALSRILFLLFWELGSRTGIIPEKILVGPSAVAGTLFDLVTSGELISNLFISFLRVVVGLAIGVTLGGVPALVAGLSRPGEVAVDPILQIKRIIPTNDHGNATQTA